MTFLTDSLVQLYKLLKTYMSTDWMAAWEVFIMRSVFARVRFLYACH